MFSKVKIVFALIIGFAMGVFIFSTNQLAVEICKYAATGVSIGELIMLSYIDKKK